MFEIGDKIETIVDFPDLGIPSGVQGTVVRVEPDLIVALDGYDRPVVVVDEFLKKK